MKPSRSERRRAARMARADAQRRRALSPVRILLKIVALPVVAAALTLSIYIRVSPFPREDALRHLVALAGCEAAAAMGVAPALRGRPGYHARNDPDGDGVACAGVVPAGTFRVTAPRPAQPAGDVSRVAEGVRQEPPGFRMSGGGAKFVRP